MIKNSLARFNTDYRKRFFNYLIAMVIIWVITFMIVKISGHENQILSLLKNTIGKSAGNGQLALFWHNFSSSLLIIILGIIPIPLYYLFIIMNAASVGMTLSLVNNPIPMFLAGILPHGLFEIPGQLMSVAISARLVWFMINKYFRHKQTNVTLKTLITESAIDTVVYVLPLLFIASIIETYITPILINMISK
ncbi:stage II sporulation protein M [Pediococcus claussenii]|uniref:Stage II sporulation protein M n=1 Tax=Pediococcus claussenii (strain ATCC BAA-344 / DSM 14800 / JCM 18046 / KCTC 3811 / LMG 21948 / P06) TaxID=701521 RepID=G8PDU1_PEDCP|nr:stage II sporulation protein M [Pediococcus claussenii]AEV95426.1 hypothetical protein PECL_1164 [Pediococcus claussenii ATCC BAA-344]ANZ68955.1 hypothetical protein AYR57_00840 [Pediococcus claussenii]ANZ70771.1 hypothetical protein AYR58_00840 [Pediococcus claussenii]